MSWMLLGAIAAAAAVAFYGWNLVGDDIVFSHRWLTALSRKGSLLAYPYYAAVHWLSTNGRMANILMPWFTGLLPRVATTALLALMVAALHWATARCAGVRNPWARIVIYGLVLTTLPWPDSILLYDCQLNYVWAAALCLMASMLVLSRKRWRSWQAVAGGLLCFVAGAMHEGCGVPLCLALWVAVWRRERVNVAWLVCFTLGALFVVASPGIWKRFVEHRGTAEWTIAEITVTSLYYYVLLLAAVVAMALTARGRDALAQLCRSPWLVWMLAATFAVPFCLVSGTIGRTGWFAQLFSLIALVRMLPGSRSRVSRLLPVAACGLWIFGLAHLMCFAQWQYRLNGEVRDMLAKYRASSCGIVMGDYTSDCDVPWLTLGKQRGVPDSDDVWTLATVRQHWAATAAQRRQLVILPASAAPLTARENAWVTPRCHLGSKSRATGVIHTYEGIDLRACRGRRGRIWIEEPVVLDSGAKLYKLTPLEADYGDKRVLTACSPASAAAPCDRGE